MGAFICRHPLLALSTQSICPWCLFDRHAKEICLAHCRCVFEHHEHPFVFLRCLCCCKGKPGPTPSTGLQPVKVLHAIQQATERSQDSRKGMTFDQLVNRNIMPNVNRQRKVDGLLPLQNLSLSTCYKILADAKVTFGEAGSDHDSRARIAESIRACYSHIVACELMTNPNYTRDHRPVSPYNIWNFDAYQLSLDDKQRVAFVRGYKSKQPLTAERENFSKKVHLFLYPVPTPFCCCCCWFVGIPCDSSKFICSHFFSCSGIDCQGSVVTECRWWYGTYFRDPFRPNSSRRLLSDNKGAGTPHAYLWCIHVLGVLQNSEWHFRNVEVVVSGTQRGHDHPEEVGCGAGTGD